MRIHKEEAALAYTFRGGIHVNEHKYTCDCPVEILPEPAVVKISMNQNIGADCTPTVKKGDRVLVGQLIGDVPEGALGCPIHSSVSGTVADIEEQRVPTGAIEKVVVIENDGMGEVSDTVTPYTGSIRDLSPEEITEKIRRAGIAGMGGAAFPTYAKINSARGKAEYLIVNCAECEPFITADHRLLLEHPEDVVRGVKILMRAVGAPQAFIAVEDNKLNTVKHLRELCGNDGLISVKVLKTKYPQGDERQLIFALTGRELPPGKLPADAGCVIFNAHTCASSYTAISTGMPSVRRIITVSGDCVATPKNLSVPVGASAMDLVAFCGGLVKTPEKMISGGPMMGQAQWNGEMPVKKSTSSVLLLSKDFSKKPAVPSVCIRCGRCIANCPMHLMPAYIAQFVQHDDMASAEKYGAMSCVECGSCSYNCPGKVEIVQYIRVAKNYIRTESARMKQAEAEAKKNGAGK